MELYDEDLQIEPYKEIGIHTLPPIDTMDGTLDEVITELFSAECALLDDGKFPVALGGDHSLTPPLVSALSKKYSVLHIGADAALRREYQANLPTKIYWAKESPAFRSKAGSPRYSPISAPASI